MGLGELPAGWAWTTVAELGKVVSGGTPSTKEENYWGGDIAWISPSDLTGYTDKFITRGAKSITASGLQNSSATAMPPGSIHFSSRAPIGYTVISSRSMTTNQGFKSLVPADGVFNEYIFYYFKSAKQLAESLATGTTFKEISGSAFSKMPVPLPPTDEQHRIVAKIEELFSELDQGVASLKTAREQLKVYRQSLLKNAFEGKLTATWRAEHRDQLETAAALQQRIAHEREARYQQQLADWQSQGKPGPKPKPPKPLPPISAEELAELPELPEGWGWIRVGELVDRVTVGYVGPMKDEYIEQGVPFLRSQNVRENRFDPEGLKFVSRSFHQSLSKSALYAGDVVVIRSGSVGVSCVIPEHLGEANCSDLVIVKTPRHVSSHLLAYYMNWQTQGRVKQKMVGVALIHFNTKSVEGFAYPLCSEQEQEIIEKQLAEKLSEADQLDQTLATALQQADALRQSILKKAFCGQLVKQDKNDEPATALLERIRASRGASPAKGRQAKLVSKPLTNC